MESSPKTSPPSIEVQKTPTSALLIATLTMTATLTSQSFTSASSRSSQLLTLTRAVNSSRIKSRGPGREGRSVIQPSGVVLAHWGTAGPSQATTICSTNYHEYRTVEL